jgi:hypothetical protein
METIGSKADKVALIARLRQGCAHGYGNGGCRSRGRHSGPWCDVCRAAKIIECQLETLDGHRRSIKQLNKRCQMIEAAAGSNAFSEDGRRISKYLHDQIRGLQQQLVEYRRRDQEEENQGRRHFELMEQREAARIRAGASGIYFVESGGLIKIGISLDVRKRLRALNHAQHKEVRPIAFIRQDDQPKQLELESELHARFTNYHQRGEWFRDCEAIRIYIASNAAQWPA